MQNSFFCILETTPKDHLFCEADCYKSFEQMIEENYQILSSKAFIESDFKEQREDSPLTSFPEPCIANKTNLKGCEAISSNSCAVKTDASENLSKKDDIVNEDPITHYSYDQKSKQYQRKSVRKTNQNINKTSRWRIRERSKINTSNKRAVPSSQTKYCSAPNTIIKKGLVNRHTPKFRRWGRKQDIKTFKLLRSELMSRDIEEAEFFGYKINEILEHSTRAIISKAHNKIIVHLMESLKWERTPYHLPYRILKLATNQKLSIREDQMLNRLMLSKSRNGKVDFNEITEQFPGKFVKAIKEKAMSLFSLP